MDIDIIKREINDAAAYLFWKLAERVGVQSASEVVIETEGRCLLKQDYSNEVFDKYIVETMDDKTVKLFKEQVANHANEFCQAEQNIIGTIYVEDLLVGRSPTAKEINSCAFNNTPKKITGTKLPQFGKLCIRHPLPAVVVCDSEPPRTIFEIKDTETALGFKVPLFMGPIDIEQIADDMWLVTGIVHIPVPSKNIGKMWNSVIQNNISVVEEMTIYNKIGEYKLGFQWDSNDSKTPLEIMYTAIKRFFL
jgi:hypothetical protein